MADEVQVDDATICRWLANTFARELGGTTIETYHSGGARPLLAYLGCDQRLSGQVARLERAIEAWADLDDPRLTLASDFAGLFLGEGHAGAPPYASLYSGAHPRLFQEPHDRMLANLGAIDVRLHDSLKEPADHLSVMLEYLARRIEMERSHPPDGWTKATHDQFIQDELLSWLPSFADRAHSIRTASDFYKAVIALTAAYMRVLVARAE